MTLDFDINTCKTELNHKNLPETGSVCLSVPVCLSIYDCIIHSGLADLKSVYQKSFPPPPTGDESNEHGTSCVCIMCSNTELLSLFLFDMQKAVAQGNRHVVLFSFSFL